MRLGARHLLRDGFLHITKCTSPPSAEIFLTRIILTRMFSVMTNLLHIDSSIRGGQSVSREISASFAEAWKTSHPDGGYTYRDLHLTPAPALSSEYVAAAQT